MAGPVKEAAIARIVSDVGNEMVKAMKESGRSTIGGGRVLAWAAAVSAAICGGAAPGAQAQGTPMDEATRENIAAAKDLTKAFQYVAKNAGPSVVFIATFDNVTVGRRDLFGGFTPLGTERRQTGLGTGVVVSEDGLVVTNNHVVGTSSEFVLRFHDGSEAQGKIVGRDPTVDLAVLKVEKTGLTAASWGDSDAMQVGDWVVAIGNPFGFSNSVTTGIVSAKGRTGLAQASMEVYEDYIQTDAAINPGNSGGPLLNLDGEVIGINTQIATKTGAYSGLGFAVPSNIVRPVIDMIARTGQVTRGWLGVGLPDEGLSVADAIGAGLKPVSDEGGGVPLTSVTPGGPAAAGGLQTGDVVIRFGGKATPTANRLRNAIAFTPPETDAEVEYYRDGRLQSGVVRLEDQLTGRLSAFGAVMAPRIGVAVTELPERDQLDLPLRQAEVKGVVVAYVVPGSPAEEAGLQPGDIIERYDNRAVTSPRTLTALDERFSRENKPSLQLIRATRRGYQRGSVTLGDGP